MSEEQEVKAEEVQEETPVSEPAPAESVSLSDDEVNNGKVLAILGYIIPILCLIPLIMRDNEFSLYHAKQCLIIWIGAMVSGVIYAVPIIGTCVAGPIVSLLLLVLAVMGLINAIKGEVKPVPIIGKFGEEWFKGIDKKA